MLQIWKIYKQTILGNIIAPGQSSETGLPYWRNLLFANLVIYIFPLSFIALIPGVYFSIEVEMYGIAVFDVVAVSSFAFIGFSRTLSIKARKIIFIISFYTASVVFLIMIGLAGPGLIYLFATGIFGIFIFPDRYSLLWSFINLAICAAIAGLLALNLSFGPLPIAPSVEEWVAVASNLVFLSFISSALIPKLFVGLHKTIQEQRKLKEDLARNQASLENSMQLVKQKNSDLEYFTYVASHDLQEPLRMISGFVAQLELKYGPQLDDKAKQYIQFASDGSKRMRQIILDLLEFSRVGNENVKLAPVNVTALLDDIAILFRTTISDKKASLIVQNMPLLMSEKTLLFQVFQNLISNALKYAREDVPPQIQVECTDVNGFWQFSVSDNGIGIDPHFYERIFVIFQRLHHKSEYAGTGLGLAICKKIIEKLGGKIWVESTPRVGTTFYFTLPKMKQA